MVPSIRPYRPDDLGRIVKLWSGGGEPPGSVDQLREVLSLVNHETRSSSSPSGGVIGALVRIEGRLHRGLQQRGYEIVRDAVCVRRDISSTVSVPSGSGGARRRHDRPGLWDRLKGMEESKDIIERRVILPLCIHLGSRLP